MYSLRLIKEIGEEHLKHLEETGPTP